MKEVLHCLELNQRDFVETIDVSLSSGFAVSFVNHREISLGNTWYITDQCFIQGNIHSSIHQEKHSPWSYFRICSCYVPFLNPVFTPYKIV